MTFEGEAGLGADAGGEPWGLWGGASSGEAARMLASWASAAMSAMLAGRRRNRLETVDLRRHGAKRRDGGGMTSIGSGGDVAKQRRVRRRSHEGKALAVVVELKEIGVATDGVVRFGEWTVRCGAVWGGLDTAWAVLGPMMVDWKGSGLERHGSLQCGGSTKLASSTPGFHPDPFKSSAIENPSPASASEAKMRFGGSGEGQRWSQRKWRGSGEAMGGRDEKIDELAL
ncbi:hypothetical protein R3P38DRAFT_2776086 [Favolaschia claudopus]|uniref:Uncharacterized protein n=1 Tax=Favolaschia claudopus TaxID=2862362 RepID=A0AAW0BQE0_9AGAR